MIIRPPQHQLVQCRNLYSVTIKENEMSFKVNLQFVQDLMFIFSGELTLNTFPLVGLSFLLKLLSDTVRYIVGTAYCCNRFWLSFKNMIGSKCCWQIRSSCIFALSNRSNRLVFSIQVRHLFNQSEKLKCNKKENRFSSLNLSNGCGGDIKL